MDHAELINTFTLGYANRTLGLRLPQKNRKAGKDIREQLQRIGVYRETGREHFNGSLVVPVMDENGLISEIYGRKLAGVGQLRKGTAYHLYLPGPHAGVWNIQALKASREIILCEALIDAMTFWVHGFRHVTASYGTSGFTNDHLAAFKHYGTQRVLIAYDRDESGNKAADALAKKLMAEGIDCFRILLPKGMDVNEYALTMTPADKALGLVVRKAEWLGKGQAPALRTDKAAKGKTPPETASAPATLLPLETSKEQEKPETPSPLAASLPEHESSPLPRVPSTIEAQVNDNEVLMTFGDLYYRVRGFTATANPTLGDTNLKHKILAIVEEEGASNASYALKLLQSEGVVTIASTCKDESTGDLVTKDYKVEGPVMLFLTTTAIDIDEELKNRCIVLDVDEGREQTRAIHAAQRRRRTLAGLQAKLEKQQIMTLHRNAQRLLRPLMVINPYGEYLTFLDDKTRLRRDHEKYLTLIDSIALLHQYQRAIKTESYDGEAADYVEVILDDIAMANQLAHEVLGKSLDELPPQTRRLLNALHDHVTAQCEQQHIQRNDYRFSRKAIRQHIGWSYDQLRVHLGRLVDMEYVLVHRGGRGQSFDYELLYNGEGEDRDAFLMGLIDVEQLRDIVGTMATVGGQTTHLGGSLGGHWGVNGARNGGTQNPLQASHNAASKETVTDVPENAYKGKNNGQSYVNGHRSDTASPLAADEAR